MYSNALIPVVISVIIIFTVGKKYCFNFSFDVQEWKRTIILAIPLLPHYLSLVILNQADKLMIRSYCGPTETALYSVAHTSGLIMTIVNTSINSTYVPWSYLKIKEGKGSDIKRITSVLVGLVMVLNVAVIWIAPEIISVLAAPEYRDSIWCFAPIAMSVLFYFIYTLFVDIEIYYGANKMIAIASCFAAALNLLLNYIFIPLYGYVAAAYTTLFSYFTTMLLHYIFMLFTLKRNNQTQAFFNIPIIIVFSIIFLSVSFGALFFYNTTLVRIAVFVLMILGVIFSRNRIINTIKLIVNRQ